MNLKPALLSLAFVLPLLSGCADDSVDPLKATLDVVGLDHTVLHHVSIEFQPSDRPTQAKYTAAGISHEPFYNAFDLLDDASKQAGFTYDVDGSYASQYGFFLQAIDTLHGDAHAGWIVSVNGIDSMVGMDSIQVNASDKIAFTFTAFDAPEVTNSGSLELTVATPTASTADATILTGTVSEPATLTVSGTHAGAPVFSVDVAADGTWTAPVTALPYGQTLVTVAGPGASATTTIVRLAEFQLDFAFTGYPVHAATSDKVLLDIDAFAAASAYDGKDTSHPEFANVHDVLVAWSEATQKTIEYGYFQGVGFSVNKVDGVGNPLTAAAPPYWCYDLNGETADLGITAQPVIPGDVIAWDFSTCV